VKGSNWIYIQCPIPNVLDSALFEMLKQICWFRTNCLTQRADVKKFEKMSQIDRQIIEENITASQELTTFTFEQWQNHLCQYAHEGWDEAFEEYNELYSIIQDHAKEVTEKAQAHSLQLEEKRKQETQAKQDKAEEETVTDDSTSQKTTKKKENSRGKRTRKTRTKMAKVISTNITWVEKTYNTSAASDLGS